MTQDRRLQLSPGVATTAVLLLLLIGAGVTYLMMRDDHGRARPAASGSAPTAPSSTPAQRPAETQRDVVVTLPKDAVDRAGITTTRVSTRAAMDSLRVPGVVEPNAYRQVSVTPLVGGRIVRASVQLGDRVRTGQSMAQVYSPELAEARTKYIAAKAMLDAHDRELQRTQKLVEIGAASRQELERIHAEHAAQTAEVESARSRLQLLGTDVPGGSASTARDSATTNVFAPIDGVVTERSANVGSVVDPTTKLFTIVDLSSVWILADVYERDLHRIREGVHATVTTTAYPDRAFEGKVGFIDPQLNATTRTAKIRVEVANRRGDLRLGMYTDVAIQSAGGTAVLVVPKEAVQSVGDRQVVYVVASTDPATFLERDVRVGYASSDDIEVLAGLVEGDSVVSKGSFFVRAEVERLGLRPTAMRGQ